MQCVWKAVHWAGAKWLRINAVEMWVVTNTL